MPVSFSHGSGCARPVAVIALGMCLAGCGCQTTAGSASASLEGTATISGTLSLYPMMIRWAEEFHSLRPEVTCDYIGELVEGGSTRSILEHPREPRTQACLSGEFS